MAVDRTLSESALSAASGCMVNAIDRSLIRWTCPMMAQHPRLGWRRVVNAHLWSRATGHRAGTPSSAGSGVGEAVALVVQVGHAAHPAVDGAS